MKKAVTSILILLLLICAVGVSSCKTEEPVLDGEFIKLSNWVNRSPNPINQIWVEHKNEDISCRITCKRGKIFKVSAQGNNDTLFSANERAKYVDPFSGTGRDYISVVLFADNQVVGYALIEVTRFADTNDLVPRILVEKGLETPITEEEAMARISQVEEVAREEYRSEKNTFLGLYTWQFTSGAMSNVMEVDYDDEVICKYVCKQGSLLIDGCGEFLRTAEVGVYQNVSWRDFFPDEGNADGDEVSILLIKDNQVVGYAAIEVERKGEGIAGFNATILVEKLLETPITEEEARATIDDFICNQNDTMAYHV